jgi:hypothetical protein
MPIVLGPAPETGFQIDLTRPLEEIIRVKLERHEAQLRQEKMPKAPPPLSQMNQEVVSDEAAPGDGWAAPEGLPQDQARPGSGTDSARDTVDIRTGLPAGYYAPTPEQIEEKKLARAEQADAVLKKEQAAERAMKVLDEAAQALEKRRKREAEIKREARAKQLMAMDRQRSYLEPRSGQRPVSWGRLVRAAGTEPSRRTGEDIKVLDEFVGSCPLAMLPVDSKALRVRIGMQLECKQFREGGVIFAPGRNHSKFVYVVHTGIVALTGMPRASSRASKGMEEDSDREKYGEMAPEGAVHKVGAGSIFGLCERPGEAGAAMAHTDCRLVAFERTQLAATIEAVYVEIARLGKELSPNIAAGIGGSTGSGRNMMQVTAANIEQAEQEASQKAVGGSPSNALPDALAGTQLAEREAEVRFLQQAASVIHKSDPLWIRIQFI